MPFWDLLTRWEEPQSGLSIVRSDGTWVSVGSAPEAGSKVTTSMNTAHSKTELREDSVAVGASIEAGFGFASIAGTAEYAFTTKQEMSETLSLTESKNCCAACDGSSVSGKWFSV